MKALTCVAPNAALVYCSPLYPGSVSDTKNVQHCEILNKFEPGDLILADKGFNMYDIMPPGVNLNIPPFLKKQVTFHQRRSSNLSENCKKQDTCGESQ